MGSQRVDTTERLTLSLLLFKKTGIWCVCAVVPVMFDSVVYLKLTQHCKLHSHIK